jgi:hypothetical protein
MALNGDKAETSGQTTKAEDWQQKTNGDNARTFVASVDRILPRQS